MISKLAGDSTWSKYSLGWSGIQALVIVALESVIFSMHWRESKDIQGAIISSRTVLDAKQNYGNPITNLTMSQEAGIIVQSTRVLSVYHVVFIVAQVFQLILLCDAMFHKNTIQIMAIVAFNCAMVAYAGVQVKQASDILVETEDPSLANLILAIFKSTPNPTPYHASLPYEIAVLAMMVVFASGFAFIAYRLYKEFGWTIYKKIGADLAMRDMYKVYQIFIMILKFDIFFQLGFSAQFLCVVVLQEQNPYTLDEFKLDRTKVVSILVTHLILSTGASIILPLLCWFALKRESKIAMSCAIAGGLAMLVYNILKLVQVGDEGDRFVGAIKFLRFFLVVNIVLGITTIYLAWACMKNFNHGLNAHIGKVSGTNIYPMESVSGSAKRWSIE